MPSGAPGSNLTGLAMLISVGLNIKPTEHLNKAKPAQYALLSHSWEARYMAWLNIIKTGIWWALSMPEDMASVPRGVPGLDSVALI